MKWISETYRALLFPEGGERTTLSDSPFFPPLFIAMATRPFSIVALYLGEVNVRTDGTARSASPTCVQRTPLFNTRARPRRRRRRRRRQQRKVLSRSDSKSNGVKARSRNGADAALLSLSRRTVNESRGPICDAISSANFHLSSPSFPPPILLVPCLASLSQ